MTYNLALLYRLNVGCIVLIILNMITTSVIYVMCYDRLILNKV